VRTTGQDGSNADRLRIDATGTVAASDEGTIRDDDVWSTARDTRAPTNDLNCLTA
jgi:hypothetical protein